MKAVSKKEYTRLMAAADECQPGSVAEAMYRDLAVGKKLSPETTKNKSIEVRRDSKGRMLVHNGLGWRLWKLKACIQHTEFNSKCDFCSWASKFPTKAQIKFLGGK